MMKLIQLTNWFRNGCTPYVEIYNRDKKIYTNVQDYAHMKFDFILIQILVYFLLYLPILRKYSTKDGQISIPVNCHKFYGEITIMIFHAKSLLGTEKVSWNNFNST